MACSCRLFLSLSSGLAGVVWMEGLDSMALVVIGAFGGEGYEWGGEFGAGER